MRRNHWLMMLLVVLMAVAATAATNPAGKTLPPQAKGISKFPPLNFKAAAAQEKANPPAKKTEIEEIEEPQPPPQNGRHGVPINKSVLPPNASVSSVKAPFATPLTGNGSSPAPAKTFKAEFLSATTIPPDTMGAVGTTHIVTVSNDRMRILTRDGVEISRLTLTNFWSGVTVKPSLPVTAFDPKVLFDRFNNRFILVSSASGTGASAQVNSGALFAVSATADPTGTWYRWSVVADPNSTGTLPGGSGNWIDYPSVGHNKKWIVVDENVFKFGCNSTTCGNTGYWGQQIYVLDKQAAYSNTLSGSIPMFAEDFGTTCLNSATQELQLGCGFTMAPAITEDNTTEAEYLIEDWDSTAGQLRISKITGTASTPDPIVIGTQFPQSANSWRFDAKRIGTLDDPSSTLTCQGTCSGGYMPQRQQAANLPSGARIAANDSRIQNSVLRNGKLWAAHTVMLSATAQAAGTTIGGVGNPADNHSGIQWWQIDPTIETGGSTPPLQRGRIEDPTANNCHTGKGGTSAVAPCNGTTAVQFGEFFAFPNISVNQNEDVFIGFSRFSPLTYPNSGYVIRRATDPPNTMRDPVVFRPGQSNYNIGSGNTTCSPAPCSPSRNDRWGDYSAAQTDPLNDTDFWTIQEYAGTNRNDFLSPSYAGPWETWWTKVIPTGPVPTTSGALIISEFRLRGPQGVRDEFVELYNPGTVPVTVSTTDNSDGWALVYSTNGTAISQVVAVVPNGTVIPSHGHFLIADNPDNTAGGTSALTYSLNAAKSTEARNADSDFGWSLDLPDNGGIALFNTATTANFSNATRLDSAGFSTIATGFFKEGNGIPAVTAATPTGQMTFYRDLSTGSPKDTGANENDFIFANTVVGETLGGTPRLGAAGPENLDGPRNVVGATTLPAALVDTGKGLGDAPNRFRDITPVANGASGTLTFRRTFTNNTGADLSRLRFRIVDITTNPAAANKADLRGLTSSSTSVSPSGGGSADIDGTTVEVPPTQAAGAGVNASFTDPSVNLATPFTAGSSRSVQFALGVQTGGIYNFCLVPEGLGPITTPAPLCFAGTTDNLNPQITGGSLSLNAGSSANGVTIATVTDDSDAAGSLTVVATSVPNGITVGSVTNAGGAGTANITANVTADCSLTTGAYNVTLKVTDSEQATNTSTFTINVTATPAPTTPTITADTNGTGTQDQACPEVPLTLHANSTGAVSYQWYKDIDLLPGETNSTYQATGSATYYVTATNACGTSLKSAGYVVQNPTPHSPFVSFRGQDSSVTTLHICQGSSQIIDSDSATGIHWWKDGVDLGAGSQSLTVTAGGVYTAQLNALGCHSQFGRNVTVIVDSMPPTPTISGDTNATGTQDQACPEQPLTLHANGATGATSYTWYSDNAVIPNENTSTLVMTGVGNISVTATNGTCITPHSATYVVQNPTPHSPFVTIRNQASTVTSIAVCAGTTVMLDSDSATGIVWWKDGAPIANSTTQAWTVTQSGVYTAQLNALGCHSQFGRNVTITINPLPATPTITPGGPTTFCAGGSVTLTSSSATGNQWRLNGSPINGATSSTFNATANGSYTVVVTDGNSCSSAPSAATTVTVTPLPATPTISGNASFCTGGNTTLTSSSAAGNQWYLNGSPIGGATSNTYVATAAGDYTVIVTASGCSSAASAAKTVTVNPLPNATITVPSTVTTLSTGNVASVANAGAGASYNWSITGGTITAGTGTSSITFTAGAVGTLTLNVTVTTAASCSDTKSANVNVGLPTVTVTSVVPGTGTPAGNTAVTINGSGFAAGATVTFGGSAATNVVVVSGIKITAKTPPHGAGLVNVKVTNTDTSNGTLNNGYLYAPQFDVNGDHTVDPSDIFYLIAYLYLGGPAPNGSAGLLSGDANGDGLVDPADIFYLVHYLFTGGPAPMSAAPRTSISSAHMNGSVSLGEPVLRGNRYVVPVIVSWNGVAPQALSLKVNFDRAGAADSANVVRAGVTASAQPSFEITRRDGNSLSYLLASDRALGNGTSAVVAEIEIGSRAAAGSLRLDIDENATLLSDEAGVRTATVATSTLAVKGVTIEGAESRAPRSVEK